MCLKISVFRRILSDFSSRVYNDPLPLLRVCCPPPHPPVLGGCGCLAPPRALVHGRRCHPPHVGGQVPGTRATYYLSLLDLKMSNAIFFCIAFWYIMSFCRYVL